MFSEREKISIFPLHQDSAAGKALNREIQIDKFSSYVLSSGNRTSTKNETVFWAVDLVVQQITSHFDEFYFINWFVV